VGSWTAAMILLAKCSSTAAIESWKVKNKIKHYISGEKQICYASFSIQLNMLMNQNGNIHTNIHTEYVLYFLWGLYVCVCVNGRGYKERERATKIRRKRKKRGREEEEEEEEGSMIEKEKERER